MAHFTDLDPCTYFPGDTINLSAIGWLEKGHPFETGDTSDEFLERLRELAKNSWAPIDFMGGQNCDLCPGQNDFYGVANVFVPGKFVVYAAPELIVHYVQGHRYRPPDAFVEAVMRCPPMGSPEYLAEINRLYRPFEK